MVAMCGRRANEPVLLDLSSFRCVSFTAATSHRVWLKWRTYRRGDILYYAGSHVQFVYILISGTIALSSAPNPDRCVREGAGGGGMCAVCVCVCVC